MSERLKNITLAAKAEFLKLQNGLSYEYSSP